MREERILFRVIASIQKQVGLSGVGQGWAMGAAKRVNAIEVQDGHARDWALVHLSKIGFTQ